VPVLLGVFQQALGDRLAVRPAPKAIVEQVQDFREQIRVPHQAGNQLVLVVGREIEMWGAALAH